MRPYPWAHMQISKYTSGPVSPSDQGVGGGVPAASAALRDQSGATSLARQLEAYQTLAGRWREARHGERAALADTLTNSPFGQRVQSTLDVFTRAAWTGPNAVRPAPQTQILKAFDDLSEDDQQIVAALRVDSSGGPTFASAAEHRARLQAELDSSLAEVSEERRADTVTLSREAQARLVGAASQAPTSEPQPAKIVVTRADLAAAVAAYSKAAG
jgi:hypothetical protein